MEVVIVGGGFAGMQAALTLKECGVESIILERSEILGGHVNNWHTLFPDITPASETVDKIISRVKQECIEVRTSCEVVAINQGSVTLKSGESLSVKAVILCTGYELFDARLKQEYGYGIYPKVITSADLELAFKEGNLNDVLDTKQPKNIAFVHCVGSRDQQVKNEHCSRVCCVTGVKQAIKVRNYFPECEVYNFYMDIRMFGAGYEEMYRTAQQEHHIHFIRGRVSEVMQNMDGVVSLKTEDTLLAKPMRISVDLLVLLVGMCPSKNTATIGLKLHSSGFIASKNSFELNNHTSADGVFVAGCAASPFNIQDTINSATNAAIEVVKYLKN